ncbi:tetraspanin-1 [Xenopus laevis]|uniref:Tetraspanin-1 n=1 Tax=Xenopus laevis TaxID=8355 RepID=A0A8J1MJ86_XENLA|nr:tetraspanin-1 [Xenopus laevis]
MGCFSFLKTMMFVFNGIIFLGGVAVLGIGIWVKVDGGSFLQILGSAAPQLMQVVNVGYLCIAVGGFLILIGFLGCCGAIKESRCMLMSFFIIILIIFIAEVAGAVLVLAFSSVSRIFIEYLGNVALKYLHNDYGESNELTTIWNATMNEQYPPVCCANFSPCWKNKIKPEVKGCLAAFEHFFSRNAKIVGGVALGICALELAAMIVSLVLFCHIGNSA